MTNTYHGSRMNLFKPVSRTTIKDVTEVTAQHLMNKINTVENRITDKINTAENSLTEKINSLTEKIDENAKIADQNQIELNLKLNAIMKHLSIKW